MKTILTEELVDIPERVEVDCKTRNITVTGPLSVLKKSFKHVAVDLHHNKQNRQMKVQM